MCDNSIDTIDNNTHNDNNKKFDDNKRGNNKKVHVIENIQFQSQHPSQHLSQHPSSHSNITSCIGIDYSKYSYNIISSLIDTLVGDIETQEYTSNKYKQEKYITSCKSFYKTQLDFLHLQTKLDPVIFKEFEEIITNILTPSSRYLLKLPQIKIYNNDLINIHTRYGVFETNNFIIKIDHQSDIFTPEIDLMYHIGNGIIYPHNIVLPYYVYIVDNSDNNNSTGKKQNNMCFSIQPRIRNTIALHKWIHIFENRFYTTTYYINMCITISKSILFIHSHNLVHGDIKPDNILIELSTNTPYIIDFGLSGIHEISQGTGGTRPFCCPETKNITSKEGDNYIWTKNNKQYDLWSIAFIFSTIIIFKDSYNYYSDYPRNYFNSDKYISTHFLNRIPLLFREPFMLVLSKKSDINLSNFICLLEDAIVKYHLQNQSSGQLYDSVSSVMCM
jgi:hypothetical protein